MMKFLDPIIQRTSKLPELRDNELLGLVTIQG